MLQLNVWESVYVDASNATVMNKYKSKIPQLRLFENKTTLLLRPDFASPKSGLLVIQSSR